LTILFHKAQPGTHTLNLLPPASLQVHLLSRFDRTKKANFIQITRRRRRRRDSFSGVGAHARTDR
jgi:hypothetical protein